MAPRNNQEHLARRRQEIIAAAERVFDRRGYAAATVDEVAAEAGLSKGSLYNYFRNKQDLFTQVFTDVIAVDEAEFDALFARRSSAREKIGALLTFWAQGLEKHKRVGRLVLEIWANAARQAKDGEMASWFSQMYSRWRGKLAKVMAQGKDEGDFEVEDPTVSAALLLAILDGIQIQTILGMGLEVNEKFLASLERAILNALKGNRPAGGPEVRE